MISFKHVSKSFDGGQSFAIDNISFDVHEGETLVLLGSSGCGKTTLLKLANLLEPSSGTVEMDGQDIAGQDPTALRRKIGYVFQGIGLFPHMTVEENVAMAPRPLVRDSGLCRLARAPDHHLLDPIRLRRYRALG